MNVIQILKLKGSSDVETIAPTTPLSEAAKILAEKRFGSLLVIEGEAEIAGILSERDIVRGLGTEGRSVLDRPVSALMTTAVESCRPADSAHSVMERMTAGRFRHMPVVDGGRIVGLLSIGDVVKARIREIEDENAAMSGMLSG